MSVSGNHSEASSDHHSHLTVRDNFDEIFEIEIECWCYGFIKFPGEITAPLVHRVIKELAPVLRSAIDNNLAFDIHHVVEMIANATAHIVPDKELCFSILAQLPTPHELNEDAQCILAQIVDRAEQRFGGVHERLERRWKSFRAKRSSAEDRLIAHVTSSK